MNSEETPDGLHRMQYAVHILEEVLAWPAKGNAELMADCLHSLTKAKKLTPKQSHAYMVRAITLAKAQGAEINRYWFQDGAYVNVRPARKEIRTEYEPIDRVKTLEEQSTPEWERAAIEARMALAKLAGKVFETVTHSKEELKAQAEQIRRQRSR